MVNLALAYGVKGILYWKYSGCDRPVLDSCSDGLVYGGDVFADTTSTWSEIKNVVGPYIDKMGPIFASLEWQHAWKWYDTPPSGAIIDSIQCDQYGVPEFGSEPSKDWLYLQVAEFEPASHSNDTAYFFLVNRRCLPEESITGTVSFNAFAGVDRELKVYHVTDMLTGATWNCDDHLPPDPTYSFNYAVPPGAGRLYRVTPRCRPYGDANGDGSIDISDAVSLIMYIFSGGQIPNPVAAADANCDGAVDISDAVFLIAYIFSGGAAPCEGCN
jgi:hypothetical protein